MYVSLDKTIGAYQAGTDQCQKTTDDLMDICSKIVLPSDIYS